MNNENLDFLWEKSFNVIEAFIEDGDPYEKIHKYYFHQFEKFLFELKARFLSKEESKLIDCLNLLAESYDLYPPEEFIKKTESIMFEKNKDQYVAKKIIKTLFEYYNFISNIEIDYSHFISDKCLK